MKGMILRAKMCEAISLELKSKLSRLLKLTMEFADESIFQESPTLADRYKSHLERIHAMMSQDMDHQYSEEIHANK